MARLSASTQRVIGNNRVTVHGSFRPDGATGIVSGSVEGSGFSVVRSNTGLYTITLDAPMAALVSFNAGVRAADATPTIVQFGDYDGTAGTIQLRVLQESGGTLAVADMTADADAEVSFELTFRDGAGSF